MAEYWEIKYPDGLRIVLEGNIPKQFSVEVRPQTFPCRWCWAPQANPLGLCERCALVMIGEIREEKNGWGD